MSVVNPIGRYSVHGELASGGMAAVYFARLVGPSGFTRTVALKRPHTLLAKDREFAMMFIDEARLAARIRHPNVVSTLDVIDAPGELALVMDYVHGESLAKLTSAAQAKGRRVPLPIAAAIMIDALHGLHAAHDATDERGQPLGIVHRDVSPQNILVGADGITRIVDFGIAKATGRLRTTTDGTIKGKYAYMAPEQIRGEAVSRSTDTYAAAIVLWELLTGQSLFRADTEAETIYKCLEATIPRPSEVAPDVPAVFDEILARALARAPGDRHPTARAFAAEIERAAPAVRASEIGAWVESLVGVTLAMRADVIARMDSDPTGTPSMHPVAGGLDPSQISDVGMVAENRWRRSARRGRIGGIVTIVLALIGCGLYVALLMTRRTGEPIPPLPVSAALVAPATSSATAVAPSPLASDIAPSAAPVAIAPSVSPSASGAPSQRSAPRGAGAKRSAACTPPFTIDAHGREIFKVECL